MPTPRAAMRALNHAVLVSTRSPSSISVPTVTISALFMFCPSRTLLSYTKVTRRPFLKGEMNRAWPQFRALLTAQDGGLAREAARQEHAKEPPFGQGHSRCGMGHVFGYGGLQG